MAYTIHFTGLVCLIEQVDNSFLAALPDGRNAADPRPGAPQPFLEPHDPYVVAVAQDIVTDNWPTEKIEDGLAYLNIDAGAMLHFDFAGLPGQLDATEYKDRIYRWLTLDPNFEITDRAAPKGTIATASLKRGTFRVSRLPESDALVTHVDVPIDSSAARLTLSLTSGATTRSVTFPNGSEIVIANVSKDFIAGTGVPSDHDDDFFIYYVMNDATQQPSGNTPQPKLQVPETNARHPFLRRGRDLNVSCSPINFR